MIRNIFLTGISLLFLNCASSLKNNDSENSQSIGPEFCGEVTNRFSTIKPNGYTLRRIGFYYISYQITKDSVVNCYCYQNGKHDADTVNISDIKYGYLNCKSESK